jgi:acetoin utilization deacetylase AcuC-like enzyme
VLEENSVLPAPLTQPSLAQRLLNKLWRPYSGRPDVLIVSLGVDPYVDDPVGKLEITQKGFREIGRLIGEAKIPVVFVLEGGYDVENIGENVGNVLQGFHERYNS